jgi:hypothetical protein
VRKGISKHEINTEKASKRAAAGFPQGYLQSIFQFPLHHIRELSIYEYQVYLIARKKGSE